MKLLSKIADAIVGRRRTVVYRSAITGKFVSKAFAKANPATTYRVEVR